MSDPPRPVARKTPTVFRPRPQFYENKNTCWSTKKRVAASAVDTPSLSQICRSPTRSVPSMRRSDAEFWCRPIQVTSAKAIRPLPMDCYDEGVAGSYFEQSFTDINKIGAGSFGDVYSAVSLNDGMRYAVKVANERYRSSKDRREKLKEVHRLEQVLGHPNIVAFWTAWEQSGQLFMQFELCNESLDSYMLSRGPLPEQQVWEFTVDLLNALMFIHQSHLIHLDVKPENVFITEQEILKLGDFGLTIQMNKMDNANGEGDSKYLPLESLDAVFGTFTDIFSLGMTILEMASNLDLPSTGEKWQILRNDLSDDVLDEIMPHSSMSLRKMVQSMMQNNHRLRPSAASLLNAPFMRQLVFQRSVYVGFFHMLYQAKQVSSKLCHFVQRLFYRKRSCANNSHDEVDEIRTPSKKARTYKGAVCPVNVGSPLLDGSYRSIVSSPKTPTRMPRYLPTSLSPMDTSSRRATLRRPIPQWDDTRMPNFARRLDMNEE